MAVWSGWVDLAGATRLVSRGWLQFAIYYKGDCSCTSKWCSAAHFRLSDTYKKATAAAVSLAPTVEQASALRKTLQQPGHSHGKGVQEPQIQRFNNTILTASHGSSSMAERKIVKRLARLHEFNRLAKKAIRDNDVHYLSEGSAQLWTLAKTVAGTSHRQHYSGTSSSDRTSWSACGTSKSTTCWWGPAKTTTGQVAR